MTRMVLILLATLTASCSFANNTAQDDHIKLVYNGLDLRVPAGHSTIGSLPERDGFLVLRYGEAQGRDYIGFARSNPAKQADCDTSTFFEALIQDGPEKDCKEEELEAFRHVFLEGAEAGVWQIEGHSLYHVIDDELAIVFAVDDDGGVVKVDSDFLDKEQLKRVFDSH